MLDLIVCGAAGRMGITIVRLAHESRGLKIAGAIEWSRCPQINEDAGEVAGVGKIGVPITAQIAPLLKGRGVII